MTLKLCKLFYLLHCYQFARRINSVQYNILLRESVKSTLIKEKQKSRRNRKEKLIFKRRLYRKIAA